MKVKNMFGVVYVCNLRRFLKLGPTYLFGISAGSFQCCLVWFLTLCLWNVWSHEHMLLLHFSVVYLGQHAALFLIQQFVPALIGRTKKVCALSNILSIKTKS